MDTEAIRAEGFREGLEVAAKIAETVEKGPIYYVDGQPHARGVRGSDIIAAEIRNAKLPASWLMWRWTDDGALTLSAGGIVIGKRHPRATEATNG